MGRQHATALWAATLAVLLVTLLGPIPAESTLTLTGCDSLRAAVLTLDETVKIGTVVMEINSVAKFTMDAFKQLKIIDKSPNPWQVKVDSDLDLEKTKTDRYTIPFECSEDSSKALLQYPVQFFVQDVDEFPPTFQRAKDSLSLSELTDVGTVVYRIKTSNPVTDKDFGTAQTLVYNIDEEDKDRKFSIGKLNGEIKLTKLLDYETEKNITLKISVKALENPSREGNTTLVINVIDMDDMNPAFTQSTYTHSILEGDYRSKKKSCFDTVPPVHAEDGDLKVKAKIIYDFAEEHDTYKSWLSIDKNNGSLCVIGKIEKGHYFVNIKAMQEDSPDFRMALAVIDLTVNDTNDHAPVIGQTNYTAAVPEDAAIGTIVLVVYATDADEGTNAEFEFKLEGPGNGSFEIETKRNQGILKIRKELDRENNDKYEFKVFAKETKTHEEKESKKSNVIISVADENDNSPVITPPKDVEIFENATIRTNVTTIVAHDDDLKEAGKITFSFVTPSSSDNVFKVDGTTGVISLKCSNCLDYSKTKEFFLIVQAEDNGKPPRTSLATLHVKVVKTKFQSPQFTQSVYTVIVLENKPPGFLIQLQASDPDSAESSLVYALSSDSDGDLTSKIDVGQNGEIKSLKPFDAEKESFLSFDVTVSDGNSMDKATVHINITDINESKPAITLKQPRVEIPENSTVGTVVTSFQITDEDKSNGGFTAWIDQGSEGKFHLDLNSNTIVTTATFDRQDKSEYNMTIVATDYGQPPLTSSTTLDVVITDSNTAPEFVSDAGAMVSDYSFSVNETAFLGFEIGQLNVRDPDKGSSGHIKYKITSITPVDDFDLDENTGSITVKRSLNYEKHHEYTLKVTATDQSQAPKSVMATVTINVDDVAESPIWPSARLQVYLTQSDVCDKDAAPSSTKDVMVLVAQSDEKVDYHLINMTKEFSLNKTTGLLVNNQKLKPGHYVLGVNACSSNENNVCSAATLTVIVKSDSVLAFCHGFYMANVNESDPIETDVLTFTVNKNDDNITYSILSGNDGGEFHVTKEGILETAKTLDRETTSQYVINVLAKSLTEEAKAQVTIKILDAPDSAPQFSDKHYTAKVKENFASKTTPILRVSAIDPDVDSKISYGIEPASVYFKVEDDGKIYLIKEIDYETMDPSHSFEFTVFAQDTTQTRGTAKVTINVEDENDNSPKFAATKPLTLPENSKIGHNLTQIKASDSDQGDAGNIVFSLVPVGFSDLFTIDRKTGVISLNCSLCLDYSKTKDMFLIVKAQDNGSPPRTSLTTIAVKVTETEFEPPAFSQSIYTVIVPENKPAGFLIRLQASDPDSAESSLVYSLSSDSDGGLASKIQVGKNGEIKSLVPFDAEKESFLSFDVTVSDGNSMDNATVHINITDINEFKPVITLPQMVNIPENSTAGTVVTSFQITDEDKSNGGFTAWIDQGSEGKFHLDLNSNTIVTTATFDRQDKSEYNMTIVATDYGQPPLTSSTTLDVVITDSNTAPEFVSDAGAMVSSYSFSVNETAFLGFEIGQLNVRDPDKGSSGDIKYKITSMTPVDDFELDENTGSITVKRSLNYEKHHEYTLKVTATDQSQAPKSVMATVTINVDDVAESPIWPSARLQVYLTQSDVCDKDAAPSSTKGVMVLVAQCDDKVDYHLINMTKEFSLNKTTGLLVNNQKLKPGRYVLGINACSSNENNVCSAATLTVIVKSDSVLAFCHGFYMANVNESDPIKTDVLTFTVNKNDDSITYSILSGNDGGEFHVTKKGILETVKELDREKTLQYVMVVSANSSSGNAVAQVIVQILDASDSPPKFSSLSYTGEVNENFASTTIPILQVSASDPDEDSMITYSIDAASDTSNGSFTIHQDGNVFLTKSIDYEGMGPDHRLTFVVCADDGVFKRNATVTITVKDQNDQVPVFIHMERNISVPENVTIPNELYQVEASDEDTNERLIYSIKLTQPKDTDNPFFINPLTGQIEVRSGLDRETTPSYTLQITVEDAAKHTSEALFLVQVTDVNDNNPSFESTIYSMNVTEGRKGLNTNITLQAHDNDVGENAQLEYNITSGNVDNAFSIVKTAASQAILKTEKALNWTSNNAVISLEITATDGGYSPNSGSCQVTVFVIDTNDHHPVFSSQHYTANVMENADNNTPVEISPRLQVSDEDGDRFGTDGVVYRIVQQYVPFSIDHKEGTVLVKYSNISGQLDRETIPGYNITIVAQDDDGKGLSSDTTIEIRVVDVDDSSPYFSNSSYRFSVMEDVRFGELVGTVSAKDEDTSSHVIFYTIENRNMPFALDFRTGALSAVGQLDAKKRDHYLLNVSASDGLHKTFVEVNITVMGVEDVCPFEDSEQIRFDISEHKEVDTIVGTITTEKIENITYIIEDPEWKSVFSVNSSGDISLLKSAISLHSPIKFDVHVKHESENIVQCSTHVTLTIVTSNDFAPEICSLKECGVEVLKFSVAENSNIGTIIGQIGSRDNDTGLDGNVHLHIDALPIVTDLITIDDQGVLTLNETIDIERLTNNGVLIGDIMSFNVTAVDGGTPSQNVTAIINVEIFADSTNVPVFTNSSYCMDVIEELKEAHVGSVSVEPNHPVAYFLSSGGAPLPFRVDNATGGIFTTEKLDREKQSLYQFVIVARNRVLMQFSAAVLVTVNVDDKNDNEPVFTTKNPMIKVEEGQKGFTKDTLITMNAVDVDEGENANVSYSFSKPYPEFIIDASTGNVSLVKALDREKTPSLELIVVARDFGHPPLSASTTLSVIVEDVNDRSPKFSSATFTKKIALENNTDYTTQPVIVMNATDDDVQENGHVFYTMTQHGNAVFEIKPITGRIYSIFPVLKIGTYDLTVTATDFGKPPLKSTATVTIIVSSSYSPSPPKLTLTPSTIDLFVGMRKGLDLNISIATENAKYVKLVETGEEKGVFSLSRIDYRVFLNKDLMADTRYLLELMAINHEGFNVTTVLEVRVLPLRFDQPVYVATIAENHKVPYTILDLHSRAERESIIPVRYALQTKTDYFEVSPEDGKVTLIKPIDREMFNMMTLNVSMELTQQLVHSRVMKREAAGSRSPSGAATITVYVTDVNDNAPSFAFPGSTLVVSVPAGAEAGHTITVLKAFDVDDDNNKIKYSIVSGDDAAISLDEESGVVSLVDPGAFKTLGRLQLLAQACDAQNKSACDTITVEITMSEDEFHLVMPISLSVFKENEQSIMGDLGSVLGYRLGSVQSKVYDDDGKIDTSKAVLFFEAYDSTTNETIPIKTISSQVAKSQEKINDIFEKFTTVKKASVQNFSDTAVIALITVACGIFVASFVAILVVCRLWRKQKMEQKKTESALKARLNADGTVNGGFKSDPDEPLELDFDLDDSSLFEQNVVSKRIGDMKNELNKQNRNQTSNPYIVIARQLETVLDENETSNSSTSPGNKRDRNGRGGVTERSGTNGEEENVLTNGAAAIIRNGSVKMREEQSENDSHQAGKDGREDKYLVFEFRQSDKNYSNTPEDKTTYDPVPSGQTNDNNGDRETAGNDYDSLCENVSDSNLKKDDNHLAMNNYIKDLLESQKEETVYTPLNNFVAQAARSLGRDSDDRNQLGRTFYRPTVGQTQTHQDLMTDNDGPARVDDVVLVEEEEKEEKEEEKKEEKKKEEEEEEKEKKKEEEEENEEDEEWTTYI